MSERYASGVGLVLSGLALVAALQPWPDSGTLTAEIPIAGESASLTPIAAALALAAIAAFLARRYELLGRIEVSLAAGVA
ncbi:hypothetical protein ACFQDG_19785, partial [Natronoarchaeum mannanilyticum]